jgi:hypothetical protein
MAVFISHELHRLHEFLKITYAIQKLNLMVKGNKLPLYGLF